MESGKIPDNAITASSTYSSGYKPEYGRLNKVIGACAWTTASGKKSNSWFQVDLGEMATVTGIATQGSCKPSTGWTTSYSLSYSTDSQNWKAYEESGKTKVRQCVWLSNRCLFINLNVPRRKLDKKGRFSNVNNGFYQFPNSVLKLMITRILRPTSVGGGQCPSPFHNFFTF
jgi:hypothetical protein